MILPRWLLYRIAPERPGVVPGADGDQLVVDEVAAFDLDNLATATGIVTARRPRSMPWRRLGATALVPSFPRSRAGQ
jgi:hypothetical protein